jgi:hypothetical protein
MAVIFAKIEAKNADVAVATASIFNDEIWKKNNISISSLFGQSTSEAAARPGSENDSLTYLSWILLMLSPIKQKY